MFEIIPRVRKQSMIERKGKNNDHDESVLNKMIFLFDHYLSSRVGPRQSHSSAIIIIIINRVCCAFECLVPGPWPAETEGQTQPHWEIK